MTLPDAILTGHDWFRGEGFCGQSLEQQFTENAHKIWFANLISNGRKKECVANGINKICHIITP